MSAEELRHPATEMGRRRVTVRSPVRQLSPALAPLWLALHERFSAGRSVQRMRVGPLDAEQQGAIADLFGAMRLPGEYATVSLTDVDASRVGCTTQSRPGAGSSEGVRACALTYPGQSGSRAATAAGAKIAWRSRIWRAAWLAFVTPKPERPCAGLHACRMGRLHWWGSAWRVRAFVDLHVGEEALPIYLEKTQPPSLRPRARGSLGLGYIVCLLELCCGVPRTTHLRGFRGLPS